MLSLSDGLIMEENSVLLSMARRLSVIRAWALLKGLSQSLKKGCTDVWGSAHCRLCTRPGNMLMTEMLQCYPGSHGQYGLLTYLEFKWFGIYVGYKAPLFELNEHIKIIYYVDGLASV